jgi:hypothetical protein
MVFGGGLSLFPLPLPSLQAGEHTIPVAAGRSDKKNLLAGKSRFFVPQAQTCFSRHIPQPVPQAWQRSIFTSLILNLLTLLV